MVILVWGIGFDQRYMESCGVNYKFMLDVPPQFQAKPSDFFTVGSFQVAIWIVCLMTFLLDAKFSVFGSHRTYWVYPVVLLVLEVACLLVPSTTFRNRYKKHLWDCLKDTILIGFWPFGADVTLGQNVMGDVLTSFVKPLADVEYSLCYFYSLILGDDVSEHVECPRVDRWFKPVLLGFPYWIRFIQCYVRYSKSKDGTGRIHFANMGKYLSGITVVFVTNLPHAARMKGMYDVSWLISYVVATVYMFMWDIVVDWGLFAEGTALRSRRMFSTRVYLLSALFNLAARMTWAINLMPPNLIADEEVNQAILTLSVAMIEIVRRCVWTNIRLENEHLNNSSKYRAMLWIPRLIGTETEADKKDRQSSDDLDGASTKASLLSETVGEGLEGNSADPVLNVSSRVAVVASSRHLGVSPQDCRSLGPLGAKEMMDFKQKVGILSDESGVSATRRVRGDGGGNEVSDFVHDGTRVDGGVLRDSHSFETRESDSHYVAL
eukprot:GHVN01106772.1.p1 GENE.GHVN01106772.1~~GHVN01106772.1.p1  ORF type:complete len:492 (-),score=39.86 GHVN01106772.1:128-1603(-)